MPPMLDVLDHVRVDDRNPEREHHRGVLAVTEVTARLLGALLQRSSHERGLTEARRGEAETFAADQRRRQRVGTVVEAHQPCCPAVVFSIVNLHLPLWSRSRLHAKMPSTVFPHLPDPCGLSVTQPFTTYSQ